MPQSMRLIPEYEPVQKLCLSFVHDFFNTRFGYGKTICEIIEVASTYVDIELFVSQSDLEHWQTELARHPLNSNKLTLNFDSPSRAILAEYVPIFAETDDGDSVGLVFQHPLLENPIELKQFSERLASRLGIIPVDIGFPFATAALAANEGIILLSSSRFQEDGASKVDYFVHRFPHHTFFVVPSLAGDVTNDLDMYLWPIAPQTWIASEYPKHSPQADSMAPALQILADLGHTVHRVPGLEPIIYDDVNTMPNYVNGVLLNKAALVPAYQRKEDEIIVGILQGYGFEVFPVDCTKIILSNSGLHCISKTIPKKVVRSTG